ncbi:hypothetical protein KR222_007565 [Zaprionus bogoriensis]|nr:hypothetical protein KR222_007565 [Zaprionus bogoriensis]
MFVAKILLVCAAVALVDANGLGGGFGAPQEVSPEDLAQATEVLKASLSKLAAGDGPNYRVVRVLSATSQVVAGSLDKYKVELVDANGAQKVCDVQIWSRSWLPNGIEVTFNCPNEPTLIKTHSA